MVNHRTAMIVLAGGLSTRLFPLTADRSAPKTSIVKRSLSQQSINANAFPKPLIPLAGTPLMCPLARQAASSCGVEDIGITVMYMAQDLRRYFGPNIAELRSGKGSSYYWENDIKMPPDTAGCCVYGWLRDLAVRENGTLKGSSDNYVVISGDIRCGADVSEILDHHMRHNSLASIGLTEVPWENIGRFGTVTLFDTISRANKYRKIADYKEKDPDSNSNLVDSSVYVVSDRLFRLIHDDVRVDANMNDGSYSNDYTDEQGRHYRLGVFSSLLKKCGKTCEDQANPNFCSWAKHIFPDMLRYHPEIYQKQYGPDPEGLYGHILSGFWSDDGTLASLLGSNHEVLAGQGGSGRFQDFSWWPKKAVSFVHDGQGRKIWLGENTRISPDSTVLGPSYLGDNVTVEAGARIESSVINGAPADKAWTISSGAEIVNSVLWPDRSALNLRAEGRPIRHAVGNVILRNCIVGSGFPLHADRFDIRLDENGILTNISGSPMSFLDSVLVTTPDGMIIVKNME